ncbi:hypothetical protein [Tamlana sp. I1]|uniref:hypothetical protein n=1 Tax=Tamlana sp. I1 TaxID=2762061 RepID=UPI00188E39FD|nr:hypothetical protein [Tamlana sp. I1]
MSTNKFLILFLTLITLTSCKDNKKENTNSEQSNEPTATKTEAASSQDIAGNYATAEYSKRNEGYDWIGVNVSQLNENEINIRVRSRADKKKPTCTFDTKAHKKSNNTYYTAVDGKTVLFTFNAGKLTIATENASDDSALYFYCSGGATFAGEYSKIDGALDASQVDKTAFTKILNLQDIGFNVKSVEKGGQTELTVLAFGLDENHGNPQKATFKGHVVDAEVEDLDSDGSPELVVYTKSNDGYGSVLGFSTLKKKSMVPIYFPPTSENSKINEGYKGQDEFSLIETTLGQRFPTANGTRQVSYKLKNGEASKVFEVSNVSDY